MNRTGLFFFILFGAALLAAVGGCAQSETIQPPEIFYGQEMCEGCGMLISDAKFAAAVIDTQARAHKFDDIGEMLMYLGKHPEIQARAYFAHDYNTQSWLRGETAFYVTGAKIISPMGSGIAAFAEQAAASEFAARVQGTVLKFDELRAMMTTAPHNRN